MDTTEKYRKLSDLLEDCLDLLGVAADDYDEDGSCSYYHVTKDVDSIDEPITESDFPTGWTPLARSCTLAHQRAFRIFWKRHAKDVAKNQIDRIWHI